MSVWCWISPFFSLWGGWDGVSRPVLAAGVAAFKTRRPPPETNGLIGHTTKTLECVPVRRSTCWRNDLPSELMAKTASLKREKHVILIMNVKGFTAWLGWGDRNWGIIKCLNRSDFSFPSLCVCLNLKWRWKRQRNGRKMGMHKRMHLNMRESGAGCSNLY